MNHGDAIRTSEATPQRLAAVDTARLLQSAHQFRAELAGFVLGAAKPHSSGHYTTHVHRAAKVSYESPDVPMISEGIKELRGCFLQLHAETDEIAKPRVFARACPQRRRRNKES